MKKNKVIFFVFILTGLLIINYPFLSQWADGKRESRIFDSYQETILDMGPSEIDRMYSEAERYNRSLREEVQVLTDGFSDAFRMDDSYEKLLNPLEDGVMCCLEIPDIDVVLPVYHGTETETLEKGAGHLYGSSLPTGGEGTHAVLAAHRGLPSKILFTDLDQLEEGDVFYIHVLGRRLAYQVDRISIVSPEQTELLEIEDNEDYVTLVTCTPYGINSHRLLVRGTRIPCENVGEEDRQDAASGFRAWSRTGFLVSVLILVFAGIMLIRPENNRKGRKNDHK